MNWMTNNLQSIGDNAVPVRPGTETFEIKPLSPYYGEHIHECTQMLTTLIHTDLIEGQLSDAFEKGEAARISSLAIHILNDFQYLVSVIDSNLLAASGRND